MAVVTVAQLLNRNQLQLAHRSLWSRVLASWRGRTGVSWRVVMIPPSPRRLGLIQVFFRLRAPGAGSSSSPVARFPDRATFHRWWFGPARRKPAGLTSVTPRGEARGPQPPFPEKEEAIGLTTTGGGPRVTLVGATTSPRHHCYSGGSHPLFGRRTVTGRGQRPHGS